MVHCEGHISFEDTALSLPPTSSMSTPQIHVKLTRPPGGLTRKVGFESRPTWDELAIRVEELYEIPKEHVAVSYVDNEGDEVTMNTQTELMDFYNAQHGLETMRFVVRDLRSPRDSSAGTGTAGSSSTATEGPGRESGAQGYASTAIQFADNMANVIASFAEMGGANREVVDGIRTAVRRGAPLWQQAIPGFQFGPYPPPPPPPGPPPPPFPPHPSGHGGRHRHHGPPGASPRHASRSPPPGHSDSDDRGDHQRYRREARRGHRHMHHGPPPPPPAHPWAWPSPPPPPPPGLAGMPPPPPPPPPLNPGDFVGIPHDADDVPPMPGAAPPPTQGGAQSRSPNPRSSRRSGVEPDFFTTFFMGAPGTSGAQIPFADLLNKHNGSGLFGPTSPRSSGDSSWGTSGAGSFSVHGPPGTSGPWGPSGSGARMPPGAFPFMWNAFDTEARRRSTRKDKESSSESEADEKK